MEIFVKDHIEPGTIIISDGWSGYRILDNAQTSVYEHKVFNHVTGNFDRGQYSISHIEHTWNHIKQEIRQIYGSILNQNFVYFLREAEFRLNISKLSNEDKLKIFRNILKNVYIPISKNLKMFLLDF